MRFALTLVFTMIANLSLAQGYVMPPYYWGIEKTEELTAMNNAFIAETAAEFAGGCEEAALDAVDLAWGYIKRGEVELAVRRFNQAWLLEPTNPGVPFGLMIATHIRGDSDQTVDKLFEMALFAMPPADHSLAYLDYSRILVQRERSDEARVLLENRIAETTEIDLRPYYKFLTVVCQALEDEACFADAAGKAE